MTVLQRVRDPLHDLIEFDDSEFERVIWEALNAREFQRLRRVKQLGFSELVYPGACHTRFNHSVGVYHTARQLSALVQARLGARFDEDRARVAMAAALVHDLGHGPFSHAFEDAMKVLDKRLGQKTAKRHELWTTDIVNGDTEIAAALDKLGGNFRSDVATLLASETPGDIYAAIVSSQFDADRLDYVRRDRMMTGAQHGGFDYSWLLANLEVDKVLLATDGETYAEVESLILGAKALQAAESYVLGLFHMYFTVYFHKATRSAEKLLTQIIARVGELCHEERVEVAGLDRRHPLVKFIESRSLQSYLRLDDFVLWSTLGELAEGSDEVCAELSKRLLGRRLYKAIDIGSRFGDRADDLARFKSSLSKARAEKRFGPIDVLEDKTSRTPYKLRGDDTPDALAKVLIRRPDGTSYQDVAERSEVVNALKARSIYRVYVRDEDSQKIVEEIAKGG